MGLFPGGRDGTLWYYRRLADTYRAVGSPRLRRLAEELHSTVAETERRAGAACPA